VLRALTTTILALPLLLAGADNLIVCDEIPAMQTLAKHIDARLHQSSEIVSQAQMPASLAGYRSVIVYIHGNLSELAETAFIGYANGGGKLVLLHHSISSGKRKNKDWFPFLGITLPAGYQYIDDATWDVIPAGGGMPFTMQETEVYLNHVDDADRTILLSLHYRDPKTGDVFDQATAGWRKKTEKGTVYYFMPGHKPSDFDYEPYVQVLTDALKNRE
jgi:hypothetical protein